MSREYTNIVYNSFKQTITLYYRQDGELKFEIKPAYWYFGILTSDEKKPDVSKQIDKLKKSPDKYNRILKVTRLNEYTLIHCLKESSIHTKIKNLKIQTFEADLNPAQRFWFDNKLTTASNYKIAYFDIEVDDTESGLSIGRDTIISFAVKDQSGREYFYSLKDTNDSEKVLLEKLLYVLEKYDVIVGWNSLGFDLPYIKARLSVHGIKWFSSNRVTHLDLMQRMIHAYRFDTRIRSFSLDYIAQRFLGEPKVQRTTKVIELYNNDYDTFKKYNLTDARLLYKIDIKNKISEMIIRQANWTNVFLKDIGPRGTGLYRMIDSLLLRELHSRKQMGPTPKYDINYLDSLTKEEYEKLRYPGGYVMDPVCGCYDHVYMFDFKSLYPTIVRTWNIGYDSLTSMHSPIKHVKNPAGTYFRVDVQSVLSKTIEQLMLHRKEYKKKLLQMVEEGKVKTPEYEAIHADEIVVKELSNSCYGIMGKRDGRYFSIDVASSITLAGQCLVKSLKEFCELNDYKFLYGDTDSGVIHSGQEINTDKFLKDYHKWLKTKLKNDWNIDISYIELEFDRYFKRYILINKKTYTGHVINQEGRKTDQIYTRGLELVRSSTCPLAVRFQEELVETLLRKDLEVSYYIDWLKNKKETVFKDINPEDLVLHNKINKSFKDYKNKTLPVYLAEKKLKKEGFLLTKDIEYIVTGEEIIIEDDKKRKRQKGVEAIDYAGEFSKEHYWDRILLPNATRILNVVFPEINWKSFTFETEIDHQLSLF